MTYESLSVFRQIYKCMLGGKRHHADSGFDDDDDDDDFDVIVTYRSCRSK